MAVEQIRRVEVQRKAAQRKTQELNVDTAITILFGTSRLEGDSFISTLRYARNEGMLEGRMMKLRQKISGGFRSMDGAMDFAVIRSLLSTARKQGWDILQTLNANPDSLIADLRVA